MISEKNLIELATLLDAMIVEEEEHKRHAYSIMIASDYQANLQEAFKEGCEDMYQQTLQLLRDWRWDDVADAISDNREHKQFVDSMNLTEDSE